MVSATRRQRAPNTFPSQDACFSSSAGVGWPFQTSPWHAHRYGQVTVFLPMFQDHALLFQVFAYIFFLPGINFQKLSTGDSCLSLKIQLTHPLELSKPFLCSLPYPICLLCSQCSGGVLLVSSSSKHILLSAVCMSLFYPELH